MDLADIGQLEGNGLVLLVPCLDEGLFGLFRRITTGRGEPADKLAVLIEPRIISENEVLDKSRARIEIGEQFLGQCNDLAD